MSDATWRNRARAQSFGRVADLYDQVRPSYPALAIDHILSAAGPDTRELLDIGSGTGRAAALFAARGLAVTAVEADADMAAVARRNLPDATVVVSRFEDWDDAPERAFDLAVCAQAWHWVDHAVALPKLARVLRPDGVMAVLINVPREGGVDLRATLEPPYEAVVPGLFATTGYLNWNGGLAEQRADFVASGLFTVEPDWFLDWDEVLDADGFVALMQTHSEYPLLDPPVLAALVDRVRAAVNAAGGRIAVRYRTSVTISRLARTPA